MTIIIYDLPGNDLTLVNTSTFSECCSQCQLHTGCGAFTWITTGYYSGYCYIKYFAGVPVNVSGYYLSAYF